MTTDNTQQQQHWLETYKSLIALSIEGFKFCALVNGGAAVAVLAYLGSIAGSKCVRAPDMRVPMGAFLLGLTACGLAMVFAYLTQLRLLNETRQGYNSRPAHTIALWIAVALTVVSLAAFAVGSWQAVIRFH
jgi:uncharacterized membrane protein YidH (DUF202 family)